MIWYGWVKERHGKDARVGGVAGGDEQDRRDDLSEGADQIEERGHVTADRRRRALTRETLLQTALVIVDAEGLEALTLRALGNRLDVSQTAIYRHIPDKAALLDGIAEQIWRETLTGIDPNAEFTDYRTFGHAYALNLRKTLMSHPNVAVLMATHPITTPEQYQLVAHTLHSIPAITSETKHPDNLLGFVQGITVLTIGYVVAEVTTPAGGAGGRPSPTVTRQAIRQSDELRWFLAPLANPRQPWSMEREFLRALDALLGGWAVD